MPRNRAVTWFLVSMVSWWGGLASAEPPEVEPKVASLSTAKQQPAEQSAELEGGVEALGGRGVVVESVGKGSALEKAGLQPGDVLYRWRRLPNPPANPDEASGELESPFDWWEVEVEEAQRGRLLLSGDRNGGGLTLLVERGEWNTTVRPQLSSQYLELYSKISETLRQGSTAHALSFWSALERKLAEVPDRSQRAWFFYWFAGELWHYDSPEKSLSLIDQTSQSDLDPAIRAALLELVGEILEQKGAPEKVEVNFLEALNVRKNPLGPSLAEAMTHSRLGTFYLYQGKLDQAEHHYSSALDIRAKLAPGSMDFAASVNNLGILALERENFSAALGYFREALDLRISLAPGSSTEGESLYNVGIVYGRLDSENLSEKFFRRALGLFEKLDPQSLRVAMTLNCLGVTYLDRQDLDLARFYFDQALVILRRVAPESLDVADTLTNLGHIFLQERDFGEAERHFREALNIQRKLAPEGKMIANNLNNIGITLGEKGDFLSSLTAHQEALQVLEKIAPQGSEVASNLYNIGMLYLEKKNRSKAREYLSRALSLRERLIPDSRILADTYAALGKLDREIGDLRMAEAWYAKAIRTFEQQILFLGTGRAGTVPFQTSREEIYRGALSVAAQKGDVKAILELLERHRGIQLAEMISSREDAALGRLPDGVASELRELQKKYEEISIDLEALTGREIEQRSGTLISSLSEIQRRYSETIESARSQGGSTFAFRYPRRFTSSDLADSLQPDQGLLYFFIVDGEIWSLFVRNDLQMALRNHSLSIGDAKGKIDRLRLLIRSGRGTTAIEASRGATRDRVARDLYNLLVCPLETSLTPLSRLLIVPDGPLHLLPWGSLIRTCTKDLENESQYLSEWKPFHLVLSGTVYSELKKSRLRSVKLSAGPDFVAFADPRYTEEDTEEDSREVSALRAHFIFRDSSWQRLLFSQREVTGIARLFPSGKARIYVGEEATEEHAKSIGDDARIIHFATHGHLDDRFPLNSALILSTPKSLTEDRENGLLQVWEIFERIRWHADLVVLSGCETALGEEQGGEGLLGLTRAFQYAGARSVLSSLWKVNDLATSELMIRFYKHLRAGLPKDQAFQAAQQELIRGPIEVINEKGEREIRDFSAPYYWAGFQLYGDWQ